MSEKRPLEAMEDMVHKLPAVNKKRKKKEAKILPPPTSSVEQEQALANLLDDLITADPQTSNPQPIPSTTEDKHHSLPLIRMQSNAV